MCGRFVLNTDELELQKEFGILIPGFEEHRYNIAPSEHVLTIKGISGQESEYVFAKWGLIPSWSKEPKTSFKTINARLESVFERPMFRSAILKRRCLIPASGFYEWKKEGEVKQPYFISRAQHKLLAFAGIYDEWVSPHGEVLDSVSILTTNARGSIKEIHHRAPVVLSEKYYQKWLEQLEPKEIKEICSHDVQESLRGYPVTRKVGNVRFDSAECIERIN